MLFNVKGNCLLIFTPLMIYFLNHTYYSLTDYSAPYNREYNVNTDTVTLIIYLLIILSIILLRTIENTMLILINARLYGHCPCDVINFQSRSRSL